jgi:hypothetical protein
MVKDTCPIVHNEKSQSPCILDLWKSLKWNNHVYMNNLIGNRNWFREFWCKNHWIWSYGCKDMVEWSSKGENIMFGGSMAYLLLYSGLGELGMQFGINKGFWLKNWRVRGFYGIIFRKPVAYLKKSGENWYKISRIQILCELITNILTSLKIDA